ncbi:TetR/AcrR family transcriptional regulator [Actinacidiphila acidipaludis]|uniref:TetR/AcrR family transcriptional regulator n=1 Tax=Actinacidiphila acidipaludis TaxID=2873382 RepID=A0ABS7QAS4_9ACTN|nr:TetR/AcrR family transcriptional regulator [Streptomyces acidipaludis]MBY8880241.1 TetR/AcrR family transcriptional regulator [Streptomyces acidipaludis]
MARTREFDIDQAVDRAMDLFWRRGYADTSLPDLLKELSIGSGSFYAAFGSKEQLYVRSLDRYVSLQRRDLENALDAEDEIRPAVRRLLASLIEADLADPARGCLVVNTATQCGDRALVEDRVAAAIRQVESLLAGALERARARGELSEDKDPRGLARFLTTFVQGVRVVGQARVGRDFVDDALSTAMRVLD